MVVDKEYYDILEISPTADEKEIKKAYKKMALKWHPDRHLENKEVAEEKFKQIAQAYQVLSDPEKRKIYDQYGKKGIEGGMGSGSGFQNMSGDTHFQFTDASEIFKNFFGSGNPFDIFSGFERGRKNRMSGFRNMGGSFGGFDDFDDDFGNMNSFRDMDGNGFQNVKPKEVKHIVNVTLEDLYQKKKKKIKMTLANGEKKVFEFDLQGKMRTGSRVRYANALDNGEDLVFEINVLPHSTFEKDGTDLILRKNISLGDALAGCKFYVTRLDGTNLLIDTKNKIVRTGTTYRMQGEGLPYPGGKGDLHIHFNIIFPESLSSEQRKKIREVFPN